MAGDIHLLGQSEAIDQELLLEGESHGIRGRAMHKERLKGGGEKRIKGVAQDGHPTDVGTTIPISCDFDCIRTALLVLAAQCSREE